MQAQRGLSEIFDAPATVVLGGVPLEPAKLAETVQGAEIHSAGRLAGRLLLGARRNEAPYFSEDTALLETLADVFGSLLENVSRQQREQEQDRRAHELSLHASRSELKALRAQINPHFLYNALNAIAGLIPRDPEVADQTIEKLAEVFRYALRDSESEWAVLDEAQRLDPSHSSRKRFCSAVRAPPAASNLTASISGSSASVIVAEPVAPSRRLNDTRIRSPGLCAFKTLCTVTPLPMVLPSSSRITSP